MFPNRYNDKNRSRNASAILSSFVGELTLSACIINTSREKEEKERQRERERAMLFVDAMNKVLLVMFSFFVSAGGIRDFSHEGRRGGGEAGFAGNSPFLAGIREAKQVGKRW